MVFNCDFLKILFVKVMRNIPLRYKCCTIVYFSKYRLCRDTGALQRGSVTAQLFQPHLMKLRGELFFLHPLTDAMVVKNIQENLKNKCND